MLSVNLSSIDPRGDMSEAGKKEARRMVNKLLTKINRAVNQENFKFFKASLFYAYSLGELDANFLEKIKEFYGNDEKKDDKSPLQRWEEDVDDECGY